MLRGLDDVTVTMIAQHLSIQRSRAHRINDEFSQTSMISPKKREEVREDIGLRVGMLAPAHATAGG